MIAIKSIPFDFHDPLFKIVFLIKECEKLFNTFILKSNEKAGNHKITNILYLRNEITYNMGKGSLKHQGNKGQEPSCSKHTKLNKLVKFVNCCS